MEANLIDYQYAFTEVGRSLHLVVKSLEDEYDLLELMPFLVQRHGNAAVITLDRNNKVSNAISTDQEEQRIISQYIHTIQDRLDWMKDALTRTSQLS